MNFSKFSTAIASVTYTTETGILSVVFKSNTDIAYYYEVSKSYRVPVKNLLANADSLGQAINFIIRHPKVSYITSTTRNTPVVIL